MDKAEEINELRTKLSHKSQDALILHLNREWNAAKWTRGEDNSNEDMQGMIYKNLFDLLSIFSSQEHSGSTAPYVLGLFAKLAAFEPIVPLTGEDDEWLEVGDGMFQNRRASIIFKDHGKAYNSVGKIFVEPDGSTYTSINSRVKIVFPYTPKTLYVHVKKRREDK